jgi:threonine dehydrogenase-like Zn-dependent dehydrogenase
MARIAVRILAPIRNRTWQSGKPENNGNLSTAVLDATGNLSSMQQAFELTASGRRLTFVGLAQGDVTFNDPDFHRRELTLLASRNATPNDFTRIIALMESGTINTRPWLTHRASFSHVPEQFALARTRCWCSESHYHFVIFLSQGSNR